MPRQVSSCQQPLGRNRSCEWSNGAMGTIEAICYRNGGPPDLPLAVMVKLDHYTGPTLHDGTVPITPLRRPHGHS